VREIKAVEPDKAPLPTTARDKNDQLVLLLQSGKYAAREIVQIERLEIVEQGWRITYRIP
jgi:hypothetical protein